MESTNQYRLQEWIDPGELIGYKLCDNPHPAAIQYLESNPHLIDWTHLSANPVAVPFLERNLDMVDWISIAMNPKAAHLLPKCPDHMLDTIVRFYIEQHQRERELSVKFPSKTNCGLDWSALSEDPCAVRLLEHNIGMIDWDALSLNPKALHILCDYPRRINWYNLSMNPGIFVVA